MFHTTADTSLPLANPMQTSYMDIRTDSGFVAATYLFNKKNMFGHDAGVVAYSLDSFLVSQEAMLFANCSFDFSTICIMEMFPNSRYWSNHFT